MAYSLKEGCNRKTERCKDDDGNKGAGDHRTDSPSSGLVEPRGRGCGGDDVQRRLPSHDAVKQHSPKDDRVVETDHINPSSSGTSVSPSNVVVTNDSCKSEDHQEANNLSETPVGTDPTSQAREGRQDPSPQPDISTYRVHNSSGGNRDKASPLAGQRDDAPPSSTHHHKHYHERERGGPTVGFRPPPSIYHSEPPPPPHSSYQQQHYHYDPHFHYHHHHYHPSHMSGPAAATPSRRYYYHHHDEYSTPHSFERYPPPVVHYHPPGSATEGVRSELQNVQDEDESSFGRQQMRSSGTSPTSMGKRESKRNEVLPLKKRKMTMNSEESERVNEIEAISVDDDHETIKMNGPSSTGHYEYEEDHIGQRRLSREDHYYRGPNPAYYHPGSHTPRYKCPPPSYPPPPYHHDYGHRHFYAAYPGETEDHPGHFSRHHYYSSPNSHGRQYEKYVQQPSERHLPVSFVEENARDNEDDESNERQTDETKGATPCRITSLAAAANTLEVKSEVTEKAANDQEEEVVDDDDDDDDGDDDTSTSADTPSNKKCVPICSSMLTKYLNKGETSSADPLLPPFAEVVNYPDYLPNKGSPTKESDGKQSSQNNHQPAEKPCVMCGVTCIFAGSTPSKSYANKKQSIIPKQNKGLCNSCDGKTWLFSELNEPIKWCKGCKNFRLLPSFGDKYRATKCIRCRERQRENYAELKRKRDAHQEAAANLLLKHKAGWGSDESERGSPELDAAMGLASLR